MCSVDDGGHRTVSGRKSNLVAIGRVDLKGDRDNLGSYCGIKEGR